MDLAALLGAKPSALSHALYITPRAAKYNRFPIPKKRGGARIITAPNERLKFIQRRLAAILLQIEHDLEARQPRSSILAHGFKKELSIVTNAVKHRNKRFVFNIDLKDFFPSINFGRVRGFFINNRDFQLSDVVATTIAQIACHDNELPQGSPCSPPISNFIGRILDVHLSKLASECRCTYTRYADDITFSTNLKHFPERIAALAQGSGRIWEPSDELRSRIIRAGFEINPQKTNMQYRDSRQMATGLIVNQKINVPLEYYKAIRAKCHNLFTTGTVHVKVDEKILPLTLESLRGQLAYIFFIRGLETGHRKLQKPQQPNFYKLYSQFLNYMSFWAVSQPTVVCEGKTDSIYIRSAIRSLSDKFPALLEKGKDGRDRIKLTFFKYTPIAKTIQDLSGGNGQLKNLVREYRSRTKGFGTQPKYPVIIVTDVDKGAVDLFKAMSDEIGKPVAGEDPWYFLHDNLYVVPVPNKGGGAETAIEDLFEASILKTKIDGKEFDRTNHEKDGDKFYSKFTFATKVIAASKVPINFSGFEPLLQAILDVQADYSSRIAAPPLPVPSVVSGP